MVPTQALISIVDILDLNNRNNVNFSKNLIFRVKILIFRFECSQALNSSVEELNQCSRKSRRPMIFNPMIQLYSLAHK